MENQHRQITGYRELSQHEIDLMNRIKERGVELGALVETLRSYAPKPHEPTERCAGYPDPDQRWVSIGATHLQEGLMALTRAVAKPTSF